MISEIRFYFTVFLKRSPIVILITSIATAFGVAFALSLPPKFQADALLLLESPQISEDLAQSTVQTAALEQLEIMEQRLIARANLIDIANKVGVFNTEEPMFPDQIVEGMRARTKFETTTGRDRASLFSISFEADTGAVAAGVVNEYVTRILAENVAIRTDRAEETLEFFELEVKQLGADLDRQGQRILEFKNANLDSLPESLDFRLREQRTLQERKSQIDREIITYNEQKDRLTTIFNATGGLGGVAPDTRSEEEKQLDLLRDELTGALAIYSRTNPRIKILEARIEALEASVGSKAASDDAVREPVAPLNALDIQLKEIDGLISSLEFEKVGVDEELAKLEVSIEKTPTVSITLEALQRDYDNIQTQYNGAVTRLSTAETGERIELLSKGERITVIRQPVIPRTPSSPNRRLIAAASMVLGIALGGGLIVILELFNRSIRRPEDLTRGLGLTPIATLPYSKPIGAGTRRRLILLVLLMMAVMSLPLGLYVVHQYYLPIDQIIEKVKIMVGMASENS